MKITTSFIHKFLACCLLSLISCSPVFAEDAITYYPAPYAAYKQLQVQNEDQSTTLIDFTQSLTRAGINIITDYTFGAYTPGIFWSTVDDNNAATTQDAPTKPKAGIWTYENATTGIGSNLCFGTSSAYGTGISNTTSPSNVAGLVIYGSGNVGIGKGNNGSLVASQQLEITGNLRLPPTTATTGIIFSGDDRFVHNFGTTNTFLGVQSGNFTMTAVNANGHNTGAGFQTLSSLTTGGRNTAFGYRSLSSNTEGSNNTAGGAEALSSNISGSDNTAVGYKASFSNTTGSSNTAAGSLALRDNTIGSNNTAVGKSALQNNIDGSSNTAVGEGALSSNKDGSFNTALGAGALRNGTTGSFNVAVGAGAGESADGDRNVFLGYQAGQNETGSDKLYIDNSNTSMPLIYGDFSADILQINGYLGVGIAPAVVGSNTYRLTLPSTSGTLGWGRGEGTSAVPSGTPPNGPGSVADCWKNYSSIRWKENITPIPSALEKVLRLRGVYYNHKESKKREVGMIAEEVGQVFPEVVSYEENGTDAVGMSYDRLVAILVEAVKELKTENQALQKRVAVLKADPKK